MRPKSAELCAGYNGLGMAVEEVFGTDTAWFSEYDDAPSRILKYRYPVTPNYGDMTLIDWAELERRHGRIHVLGGGHSLPGLVRCGTAEGHD